MSEFDQTFGASLRAIFGRDYDGPFSLTAATEEGQDEVSTTADKALMLFVKAASAHVWCDLEHDGQFGLTLAFRDKQRAYAAAAKLNPSFVSVHKNGAAYLTYLFSDDADEVSALAVDLMDGDSDDAYTSLAFPLAYGDISLSDDDLALVDGKIEFEPVTVAEFEAAFFGGGDDGAGEKVEGLSSETLSEDKGQTVKRVSDGSPTEMWNDAEVYGDLDDKVLKTPIQIANGKDSRDMKWKTTPAAKLELFIDVLTRHVAGDKDGTCFVPGALAGPKRSNNAVTKMCLMGIDVDSGESLVDTAQKIQDAGLMAVLYTTHSHGTRQIEIKQDKFFKWASDHGHDTNPNTELVKLFLTNEKKYETDVIEFAEFEEVIHLVTGVQIVVKTRPIDKFRIVFPLASDYVLAKQHMAQKDAIKAWGDMILGMGRELGIHVDRAARDCSRLFYYPRHDTKRAQNKRIIVVAGKPLDWTKIKKVNIQDSRIADPFGQAAHSMGANMSGRPTSPDLGIDLRKWAAESAQGFEISRVFEEYCPDLLKEETAPGKFTVICPFDEDHSNAGDENDKGCFICDAGMDYETFAFRCSHDSCAGRDRLDMLNKMFMDGTIPDSILGDRSFYCDQDEPVEDETDEENEDGETEETKPKDKRTYAEKLLSATQLAGGLTRTYTHDQLVLALEAVAQLQLGDEMRIVKTICDNTKLTESKIAKLRETLAKASNDQVDDKPYNSKKVSNTIKNRFNTTRNSPRPFILMDENRKEAIIGHVIDSLKEVNFGREEVAASGKREAVQEIKAAHGLFAYAEAPTLIKYNGNNDTFEMKNLDKYSLSFFIMDHLYLGKMIDGNTVVNEPAPDWMLDLVMASSSLPLLPLTALSELPYFNESGKFIATAGYDTKAQKYLKLKSDVAAKFAPGSKLYKTNPTLEDVDFALNELFGQVFADFPFDDGDPANPANGEASRAHLLCMMLQPLVRYMIKGPCPMYRINKPAPGTGASKMINSAMVISYGAKGTPGTLSMDEEENRKNITSQFSAGRPYIFYDNINVPITSTALAIIATSPIWQDRILGRTALTNVQNFMQVMLAGNNITASEENSRRMINIQLNLYANPEDPSVIARRTERYKIKDLDSFVDEHKDTLFGFLVTIVHYWINKGMPMWSGDPLASYEDYCKIMGGILESIEMPGFLGNRDMTSKANSSDEMAWLDFFTELINKKKFNKEPLTSAQIIQVYMDLDTSAPTLTVNGTNWRVTGAQHDDKKFNYLEMMITKQAGKVFTLQIEGMSVEYMLQKTNVEHKVMFQLVPNPHKSNF